MRFAIVKSSDLGGRIDPVFHLLRAEHAPIVEEIMRVLTRDQIGELAFKLPFDKKAAEAVCPRMTGGTFSGSRGQTFFNEWISGILQSKSPVPNKHRDLAVYVAAAANDAAAKMLTELLELAQRKKAVVQSFLDTVKLAKPAPLLETLIRKGEELFDAKNGEPKPRKATGPEAEEEAAGQS